jgi:hypothetical protein
MLYNSAEAGNRDFAFDELCLPLKGSKTIPSEAELTFVTFGRIKDRRAIPHIENYLAEFRPNLEGNVLRNAEHALRELKKLGETEQADE